MSKSLIVRLPDSRSSARSAPISYTAPVKPPPPRTSAVLELRRRRVLVSSLTTLPMGARSLLAGLRDFAAPGGFGTRMLRIAVLACALLCAVAASSAEAAGLAKTKRILRAQMAKAGAYAGAHVVELETGRALYTEDGSVPRIPASVEKLYTTAAALRSFG